MKDEIEFQPLDPSSFWSDPAITPDVTITSEKLNKMYNELINYQYGAINKQRAAGKKWMLGNEPNYYSLLRGEWDDGPSTEKDLGSLLETLL